jgi:predicted DNA-binding protein (UPF0251 family)
MLPRIETKQGTIKNRKRKSVALEPSERRAFKKWVSAQPTQIDAADTLGLSRFTVADILAKGTGSPESIEKIKSVIGYAA